MPCLYMPAFGNGEALMPHIRGAARRNCIPTQRVGTRPNRTGQEMRLVRFGYDVAASGHLVTWWCLLRDAGASGA